MGMGLQTSLGYATLNSGEAETRAELTRSFGESRARATQVLNRAKLDDPSTDQGKRRLEYSDGQTGIGRLVVASSFTVEPNTSLECFDRVHTIGHRHAVRCRRFAGTHRTKCPECPPTCHAVSGRDATAIGLSTLRNSEHGHCDGSLAIESLSRAPCDRGLER